MLRKCPRCQRQFRPEEQDQYHCKPCLKHYMPHQVEKTNPMEIHPTGLGAGQTMDLRSGTKRKAKTISEIMKG